MTENLYELDKINKEAITLAKCGTKKTAITGGLGENSYSVVGTVGQTYENYLTFRH